jgi:hypothetical protein
MKPIRVSITGVDGSGKTTVIHELRRRQIPGVHLFRAPQYHDVPELPGNWAKLSADIEALNRLADGTGNLHLKASSLFLSMTLYGDVEAWFAAHAGARVLVGERQPLLDSLAYSQFYRRYMKAAMDERELEPELKRRLGAEGLGRLSNWMECLASRDPDLRGGMRSFWNLPLYTRALFDLPQAVLLQRLQKLYSVEAPEQVIVLTLDPGSLRRRLELKAGARAGAELHEKATVLEDLQKGLEGWAQAFPKSFPGTRVDLLSVGSLAVAETCDALTGILPV